MFLKPSGVSWPSSPSARPPLLDYYRDRQVRIETIQVGAGATAEEMWRAIESSRPDE